MAIKEVQYVSNSVLEFPKSDVNCSRVIAIRPVGFSWGPGDLSATFTIKEMDITKQQEDDLIAKKIGVDKTGPTTKAFISVHVDDQIPSEPIV